jgi:cytochrome c-type biogenesis protein CcmH
MTRLALILALLLAGPALAVQPDEILSDPALEERARDISGGLRCPVCRNESIDDSSAPVSRDLRLLVRERLVAGDSDREVVAYIVDRYGEYVLLEPTKDGGNLILWLAAPALLLAALGIGYNAIRARASSEGPDSLSEDEEARLNELLGKR